MSAASRTDDRGVVEVLDRNAYEQSTRWYDETDGRWKIRADVFQCGHCGRLWDDAVVTSATPTPSARCPFEYDHVHEEVSRFTLTIDTDNAAFASDEEAEDEENQAAMDGPFRAAEIARILRNLADRVEYGSVALGKPDNGAVTDENGNVCGRWSWGWSPA